MLLHVRQVLRGDLRDRNVVDVDVLLANQVEQQVERTFVDLADHDGEREVASPVSAFAPTAFVQDASAPVSVADSVRRDYGEFSP